MANYTIKNYMGDIASDPLDDQANTVASGLKDFIGLLTDDKSNVEQLGDLVKAAWDLKSTLIPALKAAQGRHKAEFGADIGMALTKLFLHDWANATDAAIKQAAAYAVVKQS